MKKKGVHLYGIAPIPFLVWMLRGAAAVTGIGIATPRVIQHMQQNKAGKAEEIPDDTQENPQEVQKNQPDVFADLKVSFRGIAPKTEIFCDYQGTDFSDEDFIVEDSDSLENGKNVRIELTENAIVKYRELYGEDPIKTSDLYQVSVPLYYASKNSDICDESLEKMKKQAEDTYASIRSEWDLKTQQFQSITYIDNMK